MILKISVLGGHEDMVTQCDLSILLPRFENKLSCQLYRPDLFKLL